MPPDVLADNMDQVGEAEEQAKRCGECTGLADCRQRTLGMFPTVEAYLGKLSFGFSFCRYKRAEMVKAKVDRLFNFSKVPAVYTGKNFDDFQVNPENAKAVRIAAWVVDNGSKGVLFFGPPGTGKTLLASILCNEILNQGRIAIFASIPDLLADIRSSYDKGNTSEILQAVNDAPFLVLDDLGAEKMTPWVGEQLFSLINTRLSNSRQTVITSNYRPQELIVRMQTVDARGNICDDLQGRRIMSRIHEMCYLIAMDGKDWRKE